MFRSPFESPPTSARTVAPRTRSAAQTRPMPFARRSEGGAGFSRRDRSRVVRRELMRTPRLSCASRRVGAQRTRDTLAIVRPSASSITSSCPEDSRRRSASTPHERPRTRSALWHEPPTPAFGEVALEIAAPIALVARAEESETARDVAVRDDHVSAPIELGAALRIDRNGLAAEVALEKSERELERVSIGEVAQVKRGGGRQPWVFE